ncbi:hypothetical protein BDR03DRAFT_987752 [Suillus americanus]|nr:hypothetical protein BDR03DRAFT_987752 [Suillus americanus]
MDIKAQPYHIKKPQDGPPRAIVLGSWGLSPAIEEHVEDIAAYRSALIQALTGNYDHADSNMAPFGHPTVIQMTQAIIRRFCDCFPIDHEDININNIVTFAVTILRFALREFLDRTYSPLEFLVDEEEPLRRLGGVIEQASKNLKGSTVRVATQPPPFLRLQLWLRKYHKTSALATEKRQEQAKESIQASQKSIPYQPPLTTSTTIAPLQPVLFMKGCCSKLIAYCEPKAFKSKVVKSASIAAVAGAPAFSTLQDLDVAMVDATVGDYIIPIGPHQCFSRCMVVPRSFVDILPDDEDINPSNILGNGLSVMTDTHNTLRRRIQSVLLTLRDTLQTAFNAIGLSRQYPQCPSFEPDKIVPSSLLANSAPTTTNTCDAQGPESPVAVAIPPQPFPNMTIYRLMTWMNSGSHQKSQAEVRRLVKDVIQAKDFNPKDLDGFSFRRCLHMLDSDGNQETVTFPNDWVETVVNVDIPTKSKDDQSISFSISGFHYQLLLEVIRSAFADHLWKDPLDGCEERVFDELYTSDSWLDDQNDLQRQPKEPGCSLERIITGLMFFSDATHLANFGMLRLGPSTCTSET